MKSETKGKKHVVGKIIGIILLLLLLALIGLRLNHYFRYLHERKLHEQAGYYHGVDIGGGRKINVVELGAENGKHTIVGLAGMWVTDYCIYMNRVNEVIGKENTLVYVDRAGNGFSDDTFKKQTVDQVVSDYRAALQKAGYEAPYILLPFSLGGLYATYWESMYPDEIEAVAYLDGTSFCGDIDERGPDSGYTIDEYSKAELAGMMAYNLLGLQRFAEYPGTPMGMTVLTEEELNLTLMAENRGYTLSVLSEAIYEYDLFHTVRDTCVKNDIPKIFIASALTSPEDLKDYYTYMNAEMEANGEKPTIDPDNAEKFWKNWEEEETASLEVFKRPFAEAVGNCELISVPGDHWIFLQKPDEVSRVLMDFFDTL